MQTSEALIEQTTQRVRTILNDKFDNAIDFEDGSFAIPHGSTSVSVIVRPYTETDSVVELMAQVVSGAKITADLTTFLLRKNAELHFGAFGLLFDDTIVYSHSLAGISIEADELVDAINAVALIADHYDDEIVAIAGGLRTADIE